MSNPRKENRILINKMRKKISKLPSHVKQKYRDEALEIILKSTPKFNIVVKTL
jgi:hypothetical protein